MGTDNAERSFMKQIVCRISEEQYEGLRCLALEQKTSIAALIRKAIHRMYGQDLEDVRDMEEELARYQASSGIGVDYNQYRQERAGSVQG
jgi:predicted DNA-binding protein